MNRYLIAAALLAASFAAQANPDLDALVRLQREPANPQIVLTDGRGNHAVQVAFDGVKLFGGSTLSFSPLMTSGPGLPTAGRAGWITIRVGDSFYVIEAHFIGAAQYPPLGAPR